MFLVLVSVLTAHSVRDSLAIITFPSYVPILSIPTEGIDEFLDRYYNIPKGTQKFDAEAYWAKELPAFRKWVTEQIKKSEENRKQTGRVRVPDTDEIADKVGSFGHYYDYGTKEIERFDRLNPPDPGKLPIMYMYKKLKKAVQMKQKYLDGQVTALCPELVEQLEEARKFFDAEVKAGKMKCECKNVTMKYTERYSVAPGDLRPTFSKESMGDFKEDSKYSISRKDLNFNENP